MGMIKGDVTDEEQLEELGDAAALESVSHLPARVKCAVLGWHTLDEALEEKCPVLNPAQKCAPGGANAVLSSSGKGCIKPSENIPAALVLKIW